MAKYYEKRLKRNPESPWDLFWLGHAWHSMREFDKALPLYLKACEHGVSKHYAGFFIGDVYDFQGKRREALDWYLDAALNSDGGGPRNAMFVGSKIGNISEPINWAAFRAKWLLATTELEANRKEKILARAKVRHELYWLSQLGALVGREKPKDEKSHERRLENMKYIQRRADGQFEEVISEVTKAIKQDGTYKVSSEKQPLYLKVQPFFLFFDSKATWSRQE